MASSHDNLSMALFCDFENVALGVRDAKYDKFDIRPVLERLLLKGSIVVKKAYCDWERYKGFKAGMHEANFELIEIPHVRQSGKNSADIRLVVDALDLCYTKSHVNTFVIISGDSDFSPLVSKLRENAKQVIGVGVKQSTSDLLIANCDEFIFYDDLVRDSQRAARREREETAQPNPRRSPDEERQRKDELEARRTQGIELAVSTFDALVAERGDSGKIWASVLKEAIKRRKPDFSESYHGFRSFGALLEVAQARGLLAFGRDEKSGAYAYRSHPMPEAAEGHPTPLTAATQDLAPMTDGVSADLAETAATPVASPRPAREGSRRRGRRQDAGAPPVTATIPVQHAPSPEGPSAPVSAPESAPAPVPVATATPEAETPSPARRIFGRAPAATPVDTHPTPVPQAQPVVHTMDAADATAPANPTAQASPEPQARLTPRKARSRRSPAPADQILTAEATPPSAAAVPTPDTAGAPKPSEPAAAPRPARARRPRKAGAPAPGLDQGAEPDTP